MSDDISIPIKMSPQVYQLLNGHKYSNEEIVDNLEESHWISVHDSICIQEATMHVTKILDADCKRVNVPDATDNWLHLSVDKLGKLKSLLHWYKSLFDGALSA